MTASLARMEKGMADVGRCLLPTTIPLRQPRRIQILFPRVAAISAPKACDVGPAVIPYIGCRATPIQFPGDAARVAALLPGSREPSGRTCGCGCGRLSLNLDRESANYTGQHLTKSFGSVAPSIFGFAHVHEHEGIHGRELVKACREFGNVCRVFGN